MDVKSICSHKLITIDVQRTLAEAAFLMRDHHVGTLVVTRVTPEGDQVAGIVTDRDLVIHGLTRTELEGEIRVGEVARAELAMIDEGAGIEAALEAMSRGGVRRLLLRTADHRLSGIVSIDDLIEVYAQQIGGLAHVIRSGLARERSPQRARIEPTQLPRFPGFGTASWAHMGTA